MYALKSVSNLRFTYPSSDRSHSKIQVVLQSKKTNHMEYMGTRVLLYQNRISSIMCPGANLMLKL